MLKIKLPAARFIAQTMLLLFWCAMTVCASQAKEPFAHGTNIFQLPASTPAKSIADLSIFVLVITGIIFVARLCAAGLLRSLSSVGVQSMPGREPAQVYGSTQIELAWTVIPILIVVVLFLATARSHPRR